MQQTLDLSPAAGGLALLPMVIPLLIATRWVATAYTHVGARRIGVAGTTALTSGLAVIAVGLAVDSVNRRGGPGAGRGRHRPAVAR